MGDGTQCEFATTCVERTVLVENSRRCHRSVQQLGEASRAILLHGAIAPQHEIDNPNRLSGDRRYLVAQSFRIGISEKGRQSHEMSVGLGVDKSKVLRSMPRTRRSQIRKGAQKL